MKKEPQKNETREKDDASISEQDIQQKLYGKSRTPRQKKSSDEDILRGGAHDGAGRQDRYSALIFT